jgi:hypothetical protein
MTDSERPPRADTGDAGGCVRGRAAMISFLMSLPPRQRMMLVCEGVIRACATAAAGVGLAYLLVWWTG